MSTFINRVSLQRIWIIIPYRPFSDQTKPWKTQGGGIRIFMRGFTPRPIGDKSPNPFIDNVSRCQRRKPIRLLMHQHSKIEAKQSI